MSKQPDPNKKNGRSLSLLGVFLLFFSSLLRPHHGFAVDSSDNRYVSPIFDHNFLPNPSLSRLLSLLELVPNGAEPGTLSELNEVTQKHLLRKGERWDEQHQNFEMLRDQLLPLLVSLGFVDEVSPKLLVYDGAIVHGGSMPRMELRLRYLVEQWKKGVRFPVLYFLTGERPLEPWECTDLALSYGTEEHPKTEKEMIEMISKKGNIPEEMRKSVEFRYVNAPMKEDASGARSIRPTTDDTVYEWLKNNPPSGTYLCVTNAPYVPRQDLVIKTIAPARYQFETIGPRASDQEKPVIFLDELARLIFQTKKWAERGER